jgi:hypothetical protein
MDTPPIVPVDDSLITYDASENITKGLKNLWRGCAGFLVGGGPSINELPYQMLAERGVCSLGINGIAAKVPVKAMTFSDPPEKFPEACWLDPGLMKLVPRRKLNNGEIRHKQPDGSFVYTGRHAKDYPNVWGYEDRGWYTPESFLTEPSASFGNNKKGIVITKRPKIIFTFFSAIRLMHFLGVRRVYLLGVDFYMNPALGVNGNYAIDDRRFDKMADRDEAEKQSRGVVDGNNSHYALANQMLIELRPYLEAAGFQIFNCNPMSRLRAFDWIPFDEALEDCRNGIPHGAIDTAGYYQKNPKKKRKR